MLDRPGFAALVACHYLDGGCAVVETAKGPFAESEERSPPQHWCPRNRLQVRSGSIGALSGVVLSGMVEVLRSGVEVGRLGSTGRDQWSRTGWHEPSAGVRRAHMALTNAPTCDASGVITRHRPDGVCAGHGPNGHRATSPGCGPCCLVIGRLGVQVPLLAPNLSCISLSAV